MRGFDLAIMHCHNAPPKHYHPGQLWAFDDETSAVKFKVRAPWMPWPLEFEQKICPGGRELVVFENCPEDGNACI